MTEAYLHKKLIEACENGNVYDVKQWLGSGAEPNFNLNIPINALNIAIQIDNHPIIELLLAHGAIVKEFVLQKAIEKDKHYLQILIPNFKDCKDEGLLMGVLQAAINISDLALAKQAIEQGAKPQSLFVSATQNMRSTKILQLLIENGFNIHAENNMLLSKWMGSSPMDGSGNWKPTKNNLLEFLFDYYLEKPKSIENFKSLRLPDKKRLFLIGLYNNNLNIMKFALMIGADKNEALNSAHRQYNAYKEGDVGSIYALMYKNNMSGKVDYQIIEYLLNSNIKFNKITISRAVCFKYIEILNALSHMPDLVYAYETAYKYENDDLCQYCIERGVSKEAQHFAKMKISAIKGDMKALRQAVHDGADVKMLSIDIIVEIINENQVKSLKYLYDAGLLLDTSLHTYLNQIMNSHKAYDTLSYLIELGLDITRVKHMPLEYKIKYPVFADMWEKRFTNIFDYTIYLVKDVLPTLEGKKKEALLKTIAELSSLPYVIKRSQGKIT
ncbi:MAG: Unknown protein [uncultured Sulfurovum sp.]|uniref:Ankyrin repeat protein n=1 Tax=uncultured Sulfurovum sp. TaxID=269237 RepID=A0A6S6S9A1_9BACT|nr:MAG: Unknown protein [uncultured Sulfurovum sp.]